MAQATIEIRYSQPVTDAMAIVHGAVSAGVMTKKQMYEASVRVFTGIRVGGMTFDLVHLGNGEFDVVRRNAA